MYNTKTLIKSIILTVIGLILVCLSLTGTIDRSFYLYFGVGLSFAGIIRIYKNIKYRTDPEFKEKVDLAIDDERFQYIRMKAWSYTAYITVGLLAAGFVASLAQKDETRMNLISIVICGMLLVYLACYWYFSRKN